MQHASPPKLAELPGWTLHRLVSVGSTNDAAATMPAWNAVRADSQTGGRGRHQRSWVSDIGGLWLSAVVPTGPPEQGWAALPLAAGLAVCETLQSVGAAPLRLRWPNDIMIRSRKLAGLLVDVFRPGLAVVGIGINVSNRPDASEPGLAGAVARLQDMVSAVPSLDDLAELLLGRLREVVLEIHSAGFSVLVPRLNRWWNPEVPIEIEIDSGVVRGFFGGVDAAGRLQVRRLDGRTEIFSAYEVTRLRECE
jgi:BirA family biotin operon repressor/biotin-[acetyl-CoA-carboxylase] ligase